MADPTIPRGESWRYSWRLERRDSDGTRTPLEPTTVVCAWLSNTFKGDAIANTSCVLSPGSLNSRDDGRAIWSSATPLAADNVTAALAGIPTGQTVYEVCDIAGERKSRALVVAD